MSRETAETVTYLDPLVPPSDRPRETSRINKQGVPEVEPDDKGVTVRYSTPLFISPV